MQDQSLMTNLFKRFGFRATALTGKYNNKGGEEESKILANKTSKLSVKEEGNPKKYLGRQISFPAALRALELY